MKTTFGTVFSRLMWGGTILSPFECAVLERLVAELPTSLRETVEAQMDSYNLVQREVDGRALNFYRKVRGRVSMEGVPLLQMTVEIAPLMRLTLATQSCEIHAVLTAVQGQAFSVTFDQDARSFRTLTAFQVSKVTHAWRSNFHVLNMTPNNAMQRSALVVTPLAGNASSSERFRPASGAPTARRR